MIDESDNFNPLHAPLWRKLLAIRVLVLCCISLAVSLFIIEWFYAAAPDIQKSRWVEKIAILFALIPLFALFYAIKKGFADLVVHFIPEGRARRLLLWGDQPAETIAAEFSKNGYVFALMPFIIVGWVAVVIIVVLLFFGGIALADSLFDAVFSGWPSWAIVITFLLIAILLKK